MGIQCPPTIIKKKEPGTNRICLFIEVDGVASRDEQRRQIQIQQGEVVHRRQNTNSTADPDRAITT